MGVPNDVWAISDVNRDYKLVPTYPSLLALPSQLVNSVIYGSAEFRTKSRFPVLCWKNPQSKTCLFRSSQPLIGVRRSRSEWDEALVRLLGSLTAPSMNGGAEKNMYIVDCRPKVSCTIRISARVRRASDLLPPYLSGECPGQRRERRRLGELG
jgi:hypothetical protein